MNTIVALQKQMEVSLEVLGLIFSDMPEKDTRVMSLNKTGKDLMQILEQPNARPLSKFEQELVETISFCKSVIVANGVFETSERLAVEKCDYALSLTSKELA